eukprot:1160896-Pelagomonas_calceolata.AAC.2
MTSHHLRHQLFFKPMCKQTQKGIRDGSITKISRKNDVGVNAGGGDMAEREAGWVKCGLVWR